MRIIRSLEHLSLQREAKKIENISAEKDLGISEVFSNLKDSMILREPGSKAVHKEDEQKRRIQV